MESQLLVFDLDGTLVDSRADLAEGINHMRSCFGLPPLPLDIVGSHVGNGVWKLVERSLPDADVDIEEALRINNEYYLSHLTIHTTLYDGVANGLRSLAAAGHRMAVLTNKPGNPSREILRHFGVADLFSVIMGGGDCDRLKPDPMGLLACMERVGYPKVRTWMIGDHCTDLETAKSAGVKSAYVQYGFGEERGFAPDKYFASFSELVGYFV